jgi:hypothetical protein
MYTVHGVLDVADAVLLSMKYVSASAVRCLRRVVVCVADMRVTLRSSHSRAHLGLPCCPVQANPLQ